MNRIILVVLLIAGGIFYFRSRGADKFTMADVQRISRGMDKADVDTILGPPSGDRSAAGLVMFEYKTRKLYIIVGYNENKVTDVHLIEGKVGKQLLPPKE